MGGHGPEEIRRETRTYVIVFVALAALTVVTVAISYLDLGTAAAVFLALLVAAVKGSLVAGYFMHLISEEKIIYAVLILTFVFFLALIILPLGSYWDQVEGWRG